MSKRTKTTPGAKTRVAAKVARRKKASNAPDVVPPAAEPVDPEQRRLLAAVFADADSDDARQVYADWLLAKGDPRGELIATQLKLHRTPDEDQPYALLTRVESLLRAHKEWIAPVRPYVREWTFERGFPATAVVDAGLFVEGAAALAAISPDLVVTITGLKKAQTEAFAAAPIGKLRGLVLAFQKLDDMQAKTILTSPRIAGLRELSLAGNRLLGLPTIEALAASPCIPTLRKLDLSGIGDADFFGALARCAPFAALRSLVLCEQLARDSLAALCGSTAFGTVETLDLSYGGELGDEAAAMLASSAAFPSLRSLELRSCSVGADGLRALARSKTLPAGLRRIVVGPLAKNSKVFADVKGEVLARFPESELG